MMDDDNTDDDTPLSCGLEVRADSVYCLPFLYLGYVGDNNKEGRDVDKLACDSID